MIGKYHYITGQGVLLKTYIIAEFYMFNDFDNDHTYRSTDQHCFTFRVLTDYLLDNTCTGIVVYIYVAYLLYVY